MANQTGDITLMRDIIEQRNIYQTNQEGKTPIALAVEMRIRVTFGLVQKKPQTFFM